MLFTSYFANIKNIDPSYRIYNIATKQPDGCNFTSIKEFFPNNKTIWAYKNKEIDELEYTKRYMTETLSKIRDDDLVNLITNITEEYTRKVVFVCYEKPDAFCHRHIVRHYLIDKYYTCFEYGSIDHKINDLILRTL